MKWPPFENHQEEEQVPIAAIPSHGEATSRSSLTEPAHTDCPGVQYFSVRSYQHVDSFLIGLSREMMLTIAGKKSARQYLGE